MDEGNGQFESTLRFVVGEVKSLTSQATKAETKLKLHNDKIKELQERVTALENQVAENNKTISELNKTIVMQAKMIVEMKTAGGAKQVVFDSSGQVKFIDGDDSDNDKTSEEAN